MRINIKKILLLVVFTYLIICNLLLQIKVKEIEDIENSSFLEYDADTIEQIEALKVGKPVIVVFGADYCPTCVNYKPYLIELKRIYGEEIVIKYVDTSVHEDIRMNYNIELIPSTLFYYSDGSAYLPSNEIDVLKNEEEVTGREYISEKYKIVSGSYFEANPLFEYGIDEDLNLGYSKYVGLLDMLQLEQIAEDLLNSR